MFSFSLPRFALRFYTFARAITRVKKAPWIYSEASLHPKMDRIEKILMADEDIERNIMTLRCEVSDVEAKILDNFLIERLERENRELEEEIEKYRNELVQLEKLNGRRQVCPHSHVFKLCEPKPEDSQMKSTDESKSTLASAPKKEKKESKKSEKVDGKKPEKGESKKTAPDDLPIDFGRLDLRVGKIIQIEKHPDADSLYVEKVDIGKQDPITVVSGLVKHIPASELEGSLVVILCNLKPAKMRGITSEGMVMCASTEGLVEVLRPPPTSQPGEVVTCEGYSRNPDTVMNPKKKIFETVAPDLKTNDEMLATYKGVKWSVGNKGFVTAKSLKGVNIK